MAGCLVANLCDREISTRLGMAEATVHVHLTRLYRKLGVHSRRQAVAKLLGVGGVTLFRGFYFGGSGQDLPLSTKNRGSALFAA
jgi:hypothetical protein